MAKEPVPVQAARVQRVGVIVGPMVAALIAAGVAIWHGHGSTSTVTGTTSGPGQNQTIAGSNVHGPVVQAGPNARVNVSSAPHIRRVEADAGGPLRIGAYVASEEAYPDGIKVAGITWRSYYADLRLDLANTDDKVMEDVNLVIATDLVIAAVDQVRSDVPGLTATPLEGGPEIIGLTVATDDGKSALMPIVPLKAPDGQQAKKFRIVIPRLSAGVAAHLVIATAAMNDSPDDCGRVLGRRMPAGIDVEANYMIPDPADPQSVHVRARLAAASS